MKTYLCKWIPPRPDFLVTMSDDEKRWMGQHGAFQNDLLDEGVIIAHGPVIEDNGGYGVSIYRIADQEEIADYTSKDPIVKNGVGHYEHFTMLHVTTKF